MDKTYKKEKLSAKKEAWILAACAVCSVLAVTYYIFSFTRGLAHSDMAAKVLFAHEQHVKGQYFPDGFCYSTGVFILGIENLIYFFMIFIKDWVLCRQAAQFVQTLFLVASIYCFFTVVFGKKKGRIGFAAGVILVVFPLSDIVYDLYYYQAAYTKNVIFLLLFFAAAGKIMEENSQRKKYVWAVVFMLLTVCNNFGIRNIALVEAPFILSILLSSFDLSSRRFQMGRYEKILMVLSVIATAGGLFFYKGIEAYTGWEHQFEAVAFVKLETMVAQITGLLAAVFQIYGVGESVKLVSLAGIALPLKFLYMLVSVVVVPVAWLVWWRKIEYKLWKWFVGYCWFSNLLLCYFFIATSTGTATFHMLSAYVNNIVLLAGAVMYMWEYPFMKKAVCMICAAYVLLFHTAYMVSWSDIVSENESSDTELLQYLEENNLDFGYAEFWNAYKYGMLTSGKVQILAYTGQPHTPWYWLTSKEWYDPGYHKGKSFLMLNNKEQVAGRYYQAAERVDQVGDYTILVYGQNLTDDPYLMYGIPQEGNTQKISTQDLYLKNKAWRDGNQICLEEGGMQYGPYMELEGGTYEVRIEGTNLKDVKFELSMHTDHERKAVKMIKRTADQAVYQFYLDDFTTEVEFIATNTGKNYAVIDRLSLCYQEKNTDAMVYYPFQLGHMDEASYYDGSILVENGGMQYGPYVDLQEGLYSVKVYGENLDLADVKVTADQGESALAVQNIQQEEQLIQYQFHLSKAAKGVECLVLNDQKEPITVTRLCIRKLDQTE